ncbi:type VI secretion system baseplate subunit TssF [Aliikangiella maris]|uniref:Type VI secretion system baseplate subunit TssF n=2 Tax=Aliikangiella maris TaxID=3162458 RepID=A0ABV2BSM5_9GAMM
MNDELLNYYNKELAYLRQQGAEFAEKHPKIAGRLKMDQDNIEDPHVSRLLEGVAFLTAKIRHKLDDCFPELTDALLNTIYPDYQAPIPAISIVQFLPTDSLESAFTLPKGSEIENVNNYDHNCSFQTAYELNVYPYQVVEVNMSGTPFDAPSFDFSHKAKSVIKINLQSCYWSDAFNQIKPADFDCFLSGAGQIPFKLFELIFNNLTGIALADPTDYKTAKSIPLENLKFKGLENNEGVIPYKNKSFSGSRLIAEYFTCPEKFLFFKITGMQELWHDINTNATLYLYFDIGDEELERHVTTSNFSYACTPIVNQYEIRTDPIQLDRYQQEVKIHPYIGETERAEVLSIKRVTLVSQDGDEIEVKPFYQTNYPQQMDEKNYYWHLRREMLEEKGDSIKDGFETYLSIVDMNFENQEFDKGWVLNVDAICSNRNQPAALPFSPGEPKMQLVESFSELLTVECKTPLSKTLRVPLHEKTRWQLVSHLTLQNFSGEQGLETLRRTLALYDFRRSPDSRNFIDGITGLKIEPKSARILVQGIRAIALGNLITIEFKENSYAGNGVFLFAKVLERFFSQYTAINSFIQLQIKIYDRMAPLYTGLPMTGNRTLL